MSCRKPGCTKVHSFRAEPFCGGCETSAPAKKSEGPEKKASGAAKSEEPEKKASDGGKKGKKTIAKPPREKTYTVEGADPREVPSASTSRRRQSAKTVSSDEDSDSEDDTDYRRIERLIPQPAKTAKPTNLLVETAAPALAAKGFSPPQAPLAVPALTLPPKAGGKNFMSLEESAPKPVAPAPPAASKKTAQKTSKTNDRPKAPKKKKVKKSDKALKLEENDEELAATDREEEENENEEDCSCEACIPMSSSQDKAMAAHLASNTPLQLCTDPGCPCAASSLPSSMDPSSSSVNQSDNIQHRTTNSSLASGQLGPLFLSAAGILALAMTVIVYFQNRKTASSNGGSQKASVARL
jgi:hypothetical protein